MDRRLRSFGFGLYFGAAQLARPFFTIFQPVAAIRSAMQTRQKPRKVLTVPGRYFTGDGEPVDVTLCDLSVGGTRFANGEDWLPPGSKLQIIIAGRGPYKASVKWCADGQCGVTFVMPLDITTFEQFQNSHVEVFSDAGEPADFEQMSPQKGQRFC